MSFYKSDAGTLVANTPKAIGQSVGTEGTYTITICNKGAVQANVTVSTSMSSTAHDADRYVVYQYLLDPGAGPLVLDYVDLDANEYAVVESTIVDISAMISGYKND